MYKLENIKSIHLELTSKCQASCPMCPRNIQGGIVNPWLNETEITIDQFKHWFPTDFIKQLTRLFMCGNLGDAIVARDTLKVFQYLRETNLDIRLDLHTNGSAQTQKWWAQLANLNVRVIFGIDGLEDTHSLYRIGTNFEKIINNAKTFIHHGGTARWDMLVFEHNKHQTVECEQLSKALGFSEFTQKNSARFRDDFIKVLTSDGRTSHTIYPTEKSINIVNIAKKMFRLKSEEPVKITCKVKNENSLYIGADGSVTPCCWLNYDGNTATIPNSITKIDYKDKGFKNPNLNDSSLKEIFDSDYFDRIEKTWADAPLYGCSIQCGKIDILNEQFK